MNPRAWESDLARAVAAATSAADRSNRTQWVALRHAIPARDPLRLFGAGGEDRFFWERPTQEFAFATSGVAAVVETLGAQRFTDAAEQTRALYASLHVCGDPAPAMAGPLLVGGFAFAPHGEPSREWNGFPASRWVFAERMWSRFAEECWQTLVHRVEPGTDAARVRDALLERSEIRDVERTKPAKSGDAPAYRTIADRPAAAYTRLVEAARRSLADGEFEKVVIARSVRVECGGGFDCTEFLDTLRNAYPSCATFAVARGDAMFLGATPERLLRLDGRRVTTSALAGSAPRGRYPEEDARFSRELIESKKEQSEHAVVVRDLRDVLAPLCADLQIPESPELLRLESIQHLETPISGTLDDDAHLFDIAGRLHPTSAVAGAPRDAALRWLHEREELARGWYGGAVGFVDPSGGGDLAVALRSALLRNETAHLFAGAGIVAGSQPESELRETRLKLRALLTPLLEI